MNASRITIGDHISNNGNNATLIHKSSVSSAFNRVKEDNGEAIANALADVARYIDQAGNQTARAHLDELLQQLAQQPADTGLVKTLWNGIVTALPAIASLPAAVALVTSVIQR